MGAGRDEGALGASPLDQEITLQVYRRLLQLLEALPLQQLPDLLLGEVSVAAGHYLSFLLIQAVVESGNWGSVLVPQGNPVVTTVAHRSICPSRHLICFL